MFKLFARCCYLFVFSCTVFRFLSSFTTMSLMYRELVALLKCVNDDAEKLPTDISVSDHDFFCFFAMC